MKTENLGKYSIYYHGYWDYFGDAEKVLYVFSVRFVHYAGFCTFVPVIQFYEKNYNENKNN